MKRVLSVLACLAGLAVALVLMRSVVSIETGAARIAAVLAPFGQKPPTVAADAEVRLFPHLAIIYRNVRIAGSADATLDRPDVTADRIIATIDVLPLLIGQTSVSELDIDRPRLRLVTQFDLAGLTPDRTLLARLQPASIVIHHGEIRFLADNGTREETLRSVEATVRWPRARGNLSLDGTAEWRGEPVQVSLQGIAPPRLAGGEPGDIEVTFHGPAARLTFAGKAMLSDRLQLDGIFSAHAEDPHHIEQWLAGEPMKPLQPSPPPSPLLPPLQIEGHLRSHGWLAALSEASAQFGSAHADGVLSARLDLPRPQLRGTLAIGSLDLTPMLKALSVDHWLDWSPDPTVIAGLDVDLRLSVGDLLVGETRIENLAASLLVADAEVHAEVGDASLLGGTGSVTLHGRVDQAGLTAGGRLALAGATINALRSALSLTGLPPTSGLITWDAEFETSGNTLRAALGRLQGQATCHATGLELDGNAAPALAFAASRSPLLQAASTRVGLNPDIDKLTCAIRFAAREIAVEQVQFAFGGLTFALHGAVSLASRALGLDGDARPDQAILAPQSSDSNGKTSATASSATASASPAPIFVPIHINGTLDHPRVRFERDVGASPTPGTASPAGATQSPPPDAE